jgi:hypothetical protein
MINTLSERQGQLMRRAANLGKFSQLLAVGLSLTLLASCGSSFSEKDLAACDTAWDNTAQVISSSPRATYSDSAPYPTPSEITSYFEDLSDLADEIVALGSDVDSVELGLSLITFGMGINMMASEFLVNPLSRGTPGITQFNDSFKAVRVLCEDSGWKM